MPLRDHFHAPLDNLTSWEGFHGQWPAMIVLALQRQLPNRFVAEPRVHSGSSIEVDVATFEAVQNPDSAEAANETGGTATALWAPPQPTLAVAAELPVGDEYAVRIFDTRRNRRLVAAIEIVSPANKDRPEKRGAFVAKCAGLLQNRVSVMIVDLVTTRNFNLYAQLLELIGQTDTSLGREPASIYAVACRSFKSAAEERLEAWSRPLEIGQPLPTLPLWLTDTLSIPLELEHAYEATCAALRIP